MTTSHLLFLMLSGCGAKSPPGSAAEPPPVPSISLTYAHLPGMTAEVFTTLSKSTYQGDPETTPPQRALETLYQSSLVWGQDESGSFVTTNLLETSTPVVITHEEQEAFMSQLFQTLNNGMEGMQYTVNIDSNGTPTSLREDAAFDEWVVSASSQIQAALGEIIEKIPKDQPAVAAVAQSYLGGVAHVFSKETILNDLIADSLLFSGQWIGADLELHTDYELDILFDSNSAGAIPGKMYFSAYEMVPCYEGAAKDSCVHLVSVTEGDPAATFERVNNSIRNQFAPMLDAAPPDKRHLLEASMALESVTVERWVNVIAEPATLRPWHTQKIETSTLTMAAEQAPVTHKIDRTESFYRWSDMPSPDKMNEPTKP